MEGALSLHRIHLIETCRRDLEGLPTQLILDKSSAVQHLIALAKHHARILVIDILHDRRDLRMRLDKCLRKVLLRWEDRRCRHKHNHNFSGRMSGPDHHMAQQSIPTIFIVDGNLKGTQQPSDCLHNLLCQTILDLTIICDVDGNL